MNTSWEIEHQCPQCGAPVILEESNRILTCTYCRVNLYITTNGPFRYYFSPKREISAEMIYVPYWQVKGMAFWCISHEILYRIIDTNVLAFQNKSFPVSIGMRPQTLKLKVVGPGVEGIFSPPQFSCHEEMIKTENQGKIFVENKNKPSSNFATFIGEGISLIYAPYFNKNGVLYDGVLGKPLGKSVAVVQENGDNEFSSSWDKNWQLEFVSMLCPNCGNDLIGDKNSLVLLCKGCHSAWRPSGKKLGQLGFGIQPSKEENVIYLPFWKMKVNMGNLDLRSYADLARMANLPTLIKEEWKIQGCYFWSPAFKINPSVFLRLSKQMTLSLHPEDITEEIPLEPLHPVSLSVEETIRSIKMNLANIIVKKENILPKLAETDIRLEEHILVYVPFIQKGSELIHPSLGFSLQKGALTMGLHL